MKVLLSKILATSVGALTLVTLAATNAAAAPVGTAAVTPKLGIRYVDEGGGQCAGPVEQWADAGTWTTPIRFDTDSRGGGCQLSFGLLDPDDVLAGLTFKVKWQVSPGGDAWQCHSENPTVNGVEQTVFNAPFEQFTNPAFRVDTDNRVGWCNLTFTVAGRRDIALDIDWTYESDNGQCRNPVLAGLPHRASMFAAPVTIGDDTDNRPGGCNLRLKLLDF